MPSWIPSAAALVAVTAVSAGTTDYHGRNIKHPEEYINVLGGTDSRYDMSHGNTLPLHTRPWGMNSWALYTDTDPTYSGWWFHPTDRRMFGMRCTHQPSPWIGDYGSFFIFASLTDPSHSGPGQSTAYSPDNSVFMPSYFKTDLLTYGTADGSFASMEMTPTRHGAMFRLKFPKYDTESGDAFIQTRQVRVTMLGNGPRDASSIGLTEDGATLITGIASDTSGGVSGGSTFSHYFAIAVYSGEEGNIPISHIASGSSSTSAFVEYDPLDTDSELITLRVGTSFISAEQALLNLNREVGIKRSFSEVLAEGRLEWDDVLGRVDVELPESYSAKESEDLYTKFYSALYRGSIFPRDISEIDADGNQVHWSPYTSETSLEGPMTTDSGFWDAYSTVYPYLSLINRQRLGSMLQGWVNSYVEGGWLPKWASPGYRGSMVGTMGDVTLADAIVKKIPGFDVEIAYEAILKDAYTVPPQNSSGVGRVCLQPYLDYGYIPRGSPQATGGTCSEVISENLLYLQADYAIAQAASVLGKTDDAKYLMSRAENYAVLFDSKKTGLFRARNIITKEFCEPFDQFSWGGDYTEAGPWQYRFHMPFDAKGLSALYTESGRDMCAELERAQTMSGVFHIGDYGSQIHEQTELIENCWGQYSHNNQPVHHMLYMFGAIDSDGVSGSCAAKGQGYLRRVQRELYSAGNAMFAGDEDNGQMGAWFVLSSIGLYSLSPGSEEYVFGSPLFKHVRISLDDGKFLDISTQNNSPDNAHIDRVTWNGVDLALGVNGINYSELMQGGELKFYMKN